MDLTKNEIISAGLAGILGTIAFSGFFAAIGNTGVVSMAIPALYGISGPSLAIGMAIHLFHGAVLGVLYALIMGGTNYGHHLNSIKKSSVLGLGYGVVTTVLLAGLLMPVWLSAVEFGGAPPLPNLSIPGLAGHLIYGAVLGAIYPVIRGKMA